MNTQKITDDQATSEKRAFTLMIASRDANALMEMEIMLVAVDNITITKNHICNGHSDPLYGVTELPDLLLFWIGDGWKIELGELGERADIERSPLIVIGGIDDPQAMRMAMKAGAVDYIKLPRHKQEFFATIDEHIDKYHRANNQNMGKITAVMNAKGGAGGSFISANVAHIMQEKQQQQVALLGLDIQFGSLCSYFDIEPEYGLIDALGNIDELDHSALKGYMIKHKSGLQLLDGRHHELLLTDDIDNESIYKLLHLLKREYNQVVVDLPRHIDLLTATVLEQADTIAIVLQQNLMHLRDAKFLLRMIAKDLGIDSEKVIILVNRYDKSAELSLQDITSTLKKEPAITIPNSFEQVNESIVEGQPFYVNHKRSVITNSMLKMGTLLGGESYKKAGGFSRFIDHFKGL